MNKSGDCADLPWSMIIEIRGRMNGRVYYMRNGHVCSRTHVIPRNPRSASQQRGRTRFAIAVQRWRNLGDSQRDRWNCRAKHLNMSGYNLYISSMLKQERDKTKLIRGHAPARKRQRWIIRIKRHDRGKRSFRYATAYTPPESSIQIHAPPARPYMAWGNQQNFSYRINE